MSKYTTQVRFICESYAGVMESEGSDSVDNIIELARSKVFNFNYPIFDEAYRSVLETKILKHYYTREIGAESVGLWKLWLNTRLNEIMPYYNDLYKSTKFEYNPLNDVDITREHQGSGTNEGDIAINGTNWNLFSATPQGSLQNLDNGEYLTEATKTTNENTNKTEINTTDEYIEKITGKQSGTSYSKLIKEHRETLINVDMMIINELKDLFMLIW